MAQRLHTVSGEPGFDLAACTLDAVERPERAARWMRLGTDALVEKEPIERGVRLTYRHTEHVRRELEELAELERSCCAFATWSVRERGDSLILDVVASPDQVPTLRAMFDVRAG